MLFQDADKKEFRGIGSAQSQTLEKSAGRVEERFYDLIEAEDLPSIKGRVGLCSIGRVTRLRTKGEKRSQ